MGGLSPMMGMEMPDVRRKEEGKARLSHRWLAQEIARAFQLPLMSVPVQMAADAFLKLAHYQQKRSKPQRQLPPHLWRAVREEACYFCLDTLAQLIGLERGPDAVEPSLAQLYERFLQQVRAYLETPPPQLAESEPTLSPAERLRYEQSLWRAARAALELCEKWRRALSQHEMPEERACGAARGDFDPSGEPQSQADARKKRATARR
jgi:hypothetical protein